MSLVVAGACAPGPTDNTPPGGGGGGVVTGDVVSLVIVPQTFSLLRNDTLTIRVIARARDSSQLVRPVAWISNDPSVATITPAGLVTALLANRSTTITATVEGKVAVTTLVVTGGPETDVPVASVRRGAPDE
ncbi:MAG: Ig-like domain-containing protein [Gemmatimonadota bacterium]